MCIRIHISILGQTYHCALLRRQTDPDAIKVYDAEAQVIETRAAAMNATRSSAPLTDGTVLDEEPCPAGTMPRLDPGAQLGRSTASAVAVNSDSSFTVANYTRWHIFFLASSSMTYTHQCRHGCR